jgi:hypothetical protein
MARSRPKLSQSPWSGLDAVRKIMDRFGEFGESLNRMAGALHGLEDSMKHLLGVTSRVTAAMLMLHGSLANSGSSPKYNKSNKDDKDKPDWDKIFEERKISKTEDTKKEEAEWAARKKRTYLENEQNKKIERLYKERIRLENLAKFGRSRRDSDLESYQRERRKQFNAGRAQKIAVEARRKVDAASLDDPALVKEYEDIATLQKKEFKEAAETDSTTNLPKGPKDKEIERWVLDTEFAYASTSKTSDEASANFNQLTPQEQMAQQQVTQLSLIAVNKLGQKLESLSLDIAPQLNANEILYNAGNKTQAEHNTWADNESKKTKISIEDAAILLKAFSQSKGVTAALINDDVNAPKLNAKSFANAENRILNTPRNKILGEAIGLPQMTIANQHPINSDPFTVHIKNILTKIRTLIPSELPNVAKQYGLDLPTLTNVHGMDKGGFSQETVAKLFKQTYNAHDANADTEMYAKLLPLLKSLSLVLNKSIDTRHIEQILEEEGYGDSDAALLEDQAKADFEKQVYVKRNDNIIRDTEKEASRLAFEQTLHEKYRGTGVTVPDGPRANVSPFSLKSSGDWDTQPTLTVDGEEIMSSAKTPKATPADYIQKLKELKIDIENSKKSISFNLFKDGLLGSGSFEINMDNVIIPKDFDINMNREYDITINKDNISSVFKWTLDIKRVYKFLDIFSR